MYGAVLLEIFFFILTFLNQVKLSKDGILVLQQWKREKLPFLHLVLIMVMENMVVRQKLNKTLHLILRLVW